MNKDLEFQYKQETGSKPFDQIVESTWIGHKNCQIYALPIKEIPKHLKEYDSENDTWLVSWPNNDYVSWLEEKVIELQKINQSEKSRERGAFRNF